MGKALRRHLRPVPATPPRGGRDFQRAALAFGRALRPHQWTKNLLLFVPLVMAKKEGDWNLTLQAVLAFGAFCLTASGVYLGNDLVDRDSDRKHPEKRRRPFASGEIPAIVGLVAAPLFLLGGLAIGATLSLSFVTVLIAYLVSNVLYTLYFKRVPILDVLVLAGFYCLRLFAGATAIDVPISEWLLAFSLFLFFSLALAKRVSELILMAQRSNGKAPGRGYRAEDLEQLKLFGSASGYLSVLVYALFINSPHVQAFYARPHVLWAIFPMLLYWISRIWLVANRGELDSDPLVFTLRDRASQILVACSMLAILAARAIF